VNPANVTRERISATLHQRPEVSSPGLANARVSHKYVVPNRNSATPPVLRIVNLRLVGCSSRVSRRSVVVISSSYTPPTADR
jgi:hypothetical protein